MKSIFMCALLLLSSIANASLVRYEWVSNGSSTQVFSGLGYFQFHENDVTEGADLSDLLVDFSLDYTTTTGSYHIDSSTVDRIVNHVFHLEADSLQMSSVNFCATSIPTVGLCSSFGHPVISIQHNFDGVFGTRSGWNATSQIGGNASPFIFAPQSFTLVPIPSSFWLFGIGILCLALKQRKISLMIDAPITASPS